MQGSVRKRGDKWYYSFEVPSVDGKRKRIERAGGKTKKEALDSLNEAIYKYNSGFIEPKKIKVENYFTEWLNDYIKPNRKLNTYERYTSIYNNSIHPHIGSLLLKDIKPFHLEKLLSIEKEKGLSNSTLQNIYGVINAALNRAVKLQLISDNICKYIDRPKRDKFIANTLSVEELKLIIDSLDTDNYGNYCLKLALKIVLELGLRRGELTALQWTDIDFNSNTLKIQNNLVYTNNKVVLDKPKTIESERILYFSDDLKRTLLNHKRIQSKNRLAYGEYYCENIFKGQKCDFILTWEDGKYIHPNYFTLKFSRLMKKLDIGKHVRFHDLRHTNATLLLEAGTDFKVIQARLGHSNISTTLDTYSHVSVKMQKAATEKLSNLMK